MKKAIYLFILVATISSCKDKNIWCEDIGNNIKPWSVYNLGDSISMHDQYGNAVLFKISKYYNQPAYEMKESGGLMKKMVDCESTISYANEANYFRMNIRSSTSERGNIRKPNNFRFDFQLGDLFTTFNVLKQNETISGYGDDVYTTFMTNYTSGNIVYQEAIVYEKDTLLSEGSVYRYVYAKDKGLVEYSTRNPARTYILD